MIGSYVVGELMKEIQHGTNIGEFTGKVGVSLLFILILWRFNWVKGSGLTSFGNLKTKINTNMKTLKTLTILLLLTVTVTVFGQTSNVTKEEKPYIEVTGMAEKEIIPDEIFIAITIRERYEGREKISIDKQEADLKEALKSI